LKEEQKAKLEAAKAAASAAVIAAAAAKAATPAPREAAQAAARAAYQAAIAKCKSDIPSNREYRETLLPAMENAWKAAYLSAYLATQGNDPAAAIRAVEDASPDMEDDCHAVDKAASAAEADRKAARRAK